MQAGFDIGFRQSWEQALAEVTERGGRPYPIPAGASDHPLGGLGFAFPVALDPSMSMANSYGVRALPSSFIVARDGTLAALAIGPRHWDNDAAHSLIEGLTR